MQFVLKMTANGQTLESKQPDKWTAIREGQRILKFPYPAEAEVWEGEKMVACLMHSPFNNKGDKWRM